MHHIKNACKWLGITPAVPSTREEAMMQGQKETDLESWSAFDFDEIYNAFDTSASSPPETPPRPSRLSQLETGRADELQEEFQSFNNHFKNIPSKEGQGGMSDASIIRTRAQAARSAEVAAASKSGIRTRAQAARSAAPSVKGRAPSKKSARRRSDTAASTSQRGSQGVRVGVKKKENKRGDTPVRAGGIPDADDGDSEMDVSNELGGFSGDAGSASTTRAATEEAVSAECHSEGNRRLPSIEASSGEDSDELPSSSLSSQNTSSESEEEVIKPLQEEVTIAETYDNPLPEPTDLFEDSLLPQQEASSSGSNAATSDTGERAHVASIASDDPPFEPSGEELPQPADLIESRVALETLASLAINQQAHSKDTISSVTQGSAASSGSNGEDGESMGDTNAPLIDAGHEQDEVPQAEPRASNYCMARSSPVETLNEAQSQPLSFVQDGSTSIDSWVANGIFDTEIPPSLESLGLGDAMQRAAASKEPWTSPPSSHRDGSSHSQVAQKKPLATMESHNFDHQNSEEQDEEIELERVSQLDISTPSAPRSPPPCLPANTPQADSSKTIVTSTKKGSLPVGEVAKLWQAARASLFPEGIKSASPKSNTIDKERMQTRKSSKALGAGAKDTANPGRLSFGDLNKWVPGIGALPASLRDEYYFAQTDEFMLAKPVEEGTDTSSQGEDTPAASPPPVKCRPGRPRKNAPKDDDEFKAARTALTATNRGPKRLRRNAPRLRESPAEEDAAQLEGQVDEQAANEGAPGPDSDEEFWRKLPLPDDCSDDEYLATDGPGHSDGSRASAEPLARKRRRASTVGPRARDSPTKGKGKSRAGLSRCASLPEYHNLASAISSQHVARSSSSALSQMRSFSFSPNNASSASDVPAEVSSFLRVRPSQPDILEDELELDHYASLATRVTQPSEPHFDIIREGMMRRQETLSTLLGLTSATLAQVKSTYQEYEKDEARLGLESLGFGGFRMDSFTRYLQDFQSKLEGRDVRQARCPVASQAVSQKVVASTRVRQQTAPLARRSSVANGSTANIARGRSVAVSATQRPTASRAPRAEVVLEGNVGVSSSHQVVGSKSQPQAMRPIGVSQPLPDGSQRSTGRWSRSQGYRKSCAL